MSHKGSRESEKLRTDVQTLSKTNKLLREHINKTQERTAKVKAVTEKKKKELVEINKDNKRLFEAIDEYSKQRANLSVYKSNLLLHRRINSVQSTSHNMFSTSRPPAVASVHRTATSARKTQRQPRTVTAVRKKQRQPRTVTAVQKKTAATYRYCCPQIPK